MMKGVSGRRVRLVAGVVGLAGTCCGLSGCFVPSAALLAGVWQTEDEAGRPVTLTFGVRGEVVRLEGHTAEEVAVTFTPTRGTVVLNCTAVTIRIPTSSGEAVVVGTLSDDYNTITGTLSRELKFGDTVQIAIPAGDITLVSIYAQPDTIAPVLCPVHSE